MRPVRLQIKENGLEDKPSNKFDIWKHDPSKEEIPANVLMPNSFMGYDVDRIIFCHGFEFDRRAFNDDDCKPDIGKYHMKKYPKMLPNYER